MNVKQGDLVIRRLRHSCDVRFVECADETGVLLVNEVEDKFYSNEEFYLFNEQYELLVRKENRLDSYI